MFMGYVDEEKHQISRVITKNGIPPLGCILYIFLDPQIFVVIRCYVLQHNAFMTRRLNNMKDMYLNCGKNQGIIAIINVKLNSNERKA